MEIKPSMQGRSTFSVFPRKLRPFTDTDYRGEDVTVPPGTTLPDLARRMFGVTTIAPFSGRYSFLTRDNKDKDYKATDDKFVFSAAQGPAQFKEHALSLISHLVEQGKALHLPITKDPDRQIDVIDSEAIWDWLLPNHPMHKHYLANKEAISFVCSNIDIAKKFCIVRGVAPGWWTASYAGKTTAPVKRFAAAIRVVVKALHTIERSPKYKQVLAETMQDMGDPLDTNVGYPFFSAEVDAAGNPITRLKLLETFKSIGYCGYDFKAFVKAVDERVSGLPVAGWPFAIAPLRRLQPGYKWNHSFSVTSLGLATSTDFRGYNTNRVAWMASYLLNLLISPIQVRWKALRKLLPGMYHDGDAKRRRTQLLRSNKWHLAEGDYSNYDRFIPIPIFRAFTEAYLGNKEHSQFWKDALHFLHHEVPIIWPDYSTSGGSAGWIFKPPAIGLLSGLKITSEEGSYVNLIVNIQALLDSGLMSESSAFAYLTQYINNPVGSKPEYFYVQSDDTLLLSTDPARLHKQGLAFKKAADDAGIRGSLMIGDRFLMRHMSNGRDTPVPARVWQNTMSNEEPYEDPLKFIVGLAMRTDGIAGSKTYDPFGSGKVQKTLSVEWSFTLAVLKSLLSFTSAAYTPVTSAVSYLKVLISAMERVRPQESDITSAVALTHPDAAKLDDMRMTYIRALAARELELAQDGDRSDRQKLQSWIYQLHKNANVPSTAILLESVKSLDSTIANILTHVTDKENTFYRFAMSKLRFTTEL